VHAAYQGSDTRLRETPIDVLGFHA